MLMDYFLVVSGLAVSLGIVSRSLHGVPVSEPMIGLVVGLALGPNALGFLSAADGTELFLTLTRVLLAFTVMTVALRYPWDQLRSSLRSVTVLLVVVLPLMVGTVALAGRGVLGLDWATAILLGAILAPTDPVLVSSVVSGEAAKEALPASLRQSLSLESGANDGLGFVFVAIGLFLTQDHTGSWLALHALGGTLGGVAVGLVTGHTAGRLVSWSRGTHQTESTFMLFTLTFSLLVLGVCIAVGLDGILAVFVGGLAYNRSISEDDRRRQSTVEEGVDRLLLLPVFVILGASAPWSDWGDAGWSLAVFVVVVLALRRIPWLLAIGPLVPFGRAARVWMGWFGPVGVAALFYASLSHEEGEFDPIVWSATSAMVAVSTDRSRHVRHVRSATGRTNATTWGRRTWTNARLRRRRLGEFRSRTPDGDIPGRTRCQTLSDVLRGGTRGTAPGSVVVSSSPDERDPSLPGSRGRSR